MKEFGIVVAIAVPIFLAVLLPLILSGNRFKAMEEKARARRLTEARRNARLLRFNL